MKKILFSLVAFVAILATLVALPLTAQAQRREHQQGQDRGRREQSRPVATPHPQPVYQQTPQPRYQERPIVVTQPTRYGQPYPRQGQPQGQSALGQLMQQNYDLANGRYTQDAYWHQCDYCHNWFTNYDTYWQHLGACQTSYGGGYGGYRRPSNGPGFGTIYGASVLANMTVVGIQEAIKAWKNHHDKTQADKRIAELEAELGRRNATEVTTLPAQTSIIPTPATDPAPARVRHERDPNLLYFRFVNETDTHVVIKLNGNIVRQISPNGNAELRTREWNYQFTATGLEHQVGADGLAARGVEIPLVLSLEKDDDSNAIVYYIRKTPKKEVKK